jgi:hypothetical protein
VIEELQNQKDELIREKNNIVQEKLFLQKELRNQKDALIREKDELARENNLITQEKLFLQKELTTTKNQLKVLEDKSQVKKTKVLNCTTEGMRSFFINFQIPNFYEFILIISIFSDFFKINKFATERSGLFSLKFKMNIVMMFNSTFNPIVSL